MNKHIMIFSMAMLLCLFCKGQNNWKLKQNKDGIEIYTKSVETSNLKAIRVHCALPVTLSQLVTVIMDVNTAVDWVYSTKSSSLLKKVSAAELYYYSEVSLPWPISNRDFVAHLKVTQDPHSKVVTIDGPVVDNYVAEKKDIVRVKSSYGRWVLTPQKNGVKIEYTLETDPGGSLPAWLVNLFVAKGPHETFKKLKEQLKKAEYKNATLAYIKE
ncbi:START domain-containing protein [Chitinophaga sp. CF118]|uniref:START domain-containing protein n=1 Tax=Chitinophaga sp. CF118 TaxID=1884367 RepID=UPI000B7DEA28|nr:START domain-containing protein [Chitinophaga sp. CF118]